MSNPTLQSQFECFARIGDSKSDGTSVNLLQVDKWMKQAQVIGRKITTTDAGICFNKYRLRNLNLSEFEKFIVDLAHYKNVDANDIIIRLINCGPPGAPNNTTSTNVSDTTKYLNTHKEKIDGNSKPKGKVRHSEDKVQRK